MRAIEITRSPQLDKLVEKKCPTAIVQGCADVIRCDPKKSDRPLHAMAEGLQIGLEIAAALMKSKVKTPKLYEFWIDDDGDFYYAYFIGNVKSIRKRLEGLEDRDE